MSPAILLLAALAAQGDTGSFVIKNFRFASGEVLPELRLHYRTLGHPRRNAAGMVRNAVLVLHGTGGAGRPVLSPLFAAERFPPLRPPPNPPPQPVPPAKHRHRWPPQPPPR